MPCLSCIAGALDQPVNDMVLVFCKFTDRHDAILLFQTCLGDGEFKKSQVRVVQRQPTVQGAVVCAFVNTPRGAPYLKYWRSESGQWV